VPVCADPASAASTASPDADARTAPVVVGGADPSDGGPASLGGHPDRVWVGADFSPDGRFLVVSYLRRPYSYTVPVGRFPVVRELWKVDGGTSGIGKEGRGYQRIATLADLPVADDIPIAFSSCRKGPRSLEWRADRAAELCWAEALDDGDAGRAAETLPDGKWRDVVYLMSADAVAEAADAADAAGPGPAGSSSLSPADLTSLRRVLTRTELRYGGISWGDDGLALCYQSWYKSRRSVTTKVAPKDAGPAGDENSVGACATEAPLFDLNYEDASKDVGTPMTRRTQWDTHVLMRVIAGDQGDDEVLLMRGKGASPDGWKPWLDAVSLSTTRRQRVWTCAANRYETLGGGLDDGKRWLDLDMATGIVGSAAPTVDGLALMLSSETPRETSQLSALTLKQGRDASLPDGWAPPPVVDGLADSALDAAGPPDALVPGLRPDLAGARLFTRFPHPCPSLADHVKRVVRYTRSDGVALDATLYTPPGYDVEKDGRLPVLLWAYPREFKTKEAAAQLRRSPHSFATIGPQSAAIWLARGYAVLDGPTMPVVGSTKTCETTGEDIDVEANDTYVEQLVASAKAAVDHVCLSEAEGGLGIGDSARVAVGGHSYGGFMTANLLCHAPGLFACGVARSGAYNRTLTPFGFQAEERTLWQARDVYRAMSPFDNADKVVDPLLLIHGAEDDNPGTFPLQSERMFAALKGHGAPCRLVLLPREGHGYRARESVLHTLAETDEWLRRFAPPNGEEALGRGAL